MQRMSDSKWRFRIGATVFCAGFASPLLIPLVTASGLPDGVKTVVSGILLAGIPEIGMLAGVAIMGKEGLARLKAMIGRRFAPILPPDRVGPVRYRIGLVLFVSPLVLAWVGPYFGDHLPGFERHELIYAAVGDVLFFSSFFVLGGDFWDKLRALFDRNARVVNSRATTDPERP